MPTSRLPALLCSLLQPSTASALGLSGFTHPGQCVGSHRKWSSCLSSPGLVHAVPYAGLHPFVADCCSLAVAAMFVYAVVCRRTVRPLGAPCLGHCRVGLILVPNPLGVHQEGRG